MISKYSRQIIVAVRLRLKKTKLTKQRDAFFNCGREDNAHGN